MAKMREFIQVEEIGEIQKQLRALNYELLGALNQTNVIRELMVEKNSILRRASQVSSMLIPEVRALNDFVGGEELEEPVMPAPKPQARAVSVGRPVCGPRNAPEIVKAAPAMPAKRKRGRPRKNSIPVKAAQAKRVVSAKGGDSLEELKRNLAKLRSDLKAVR